jgi:hypothetical protein
MNKKHSLKNARGLKDLRRSKSHRMSQKRNTLKNRHVAEGTTSASQTIEGEGDAFHFNGRKAKVLVPHQ